MSALAELRERLATATGPDVICQLSRPVLDAILTRLPKKVDQSEICSLLLDALGPGSPSVNAALALLDRAMPRCDYSLERMNGEFVAAIGPKGLSSWTGEASSPVLSHAILSALLAAIAQGEGNG